VALNWPGGLSYKVLSCTLHAANEEEQPLLLLPLLFAVAVDVTVVAVADGVLLLWLLPSHPPVVVVADVVAVAVDAVVVAVATL
jgi:hypothetical protein